MLFDNSSQRILGLTCLTPQMKKKKKQLTKDYYNFLLKCLNHW